MHRVHRPIWTSLLLATTLFVCCAVETHSACADEYQPQSAVGKFMQGLNPQNWKSSMLQNILPGQNERDQLKQRKDGLVQEVKNTAMRSWQKTKDTLNPKRLIPTNLFGNSAAAQPSSQPQGGGFFSSLLGGGSNAAAEISNSANDFLRQQKINR